VWPEGIVNNLTERTLAERAFSAIHERIISGEYGPGYSLRIEHLAETLQISPTPIREALHRLQSLGLAEYTPHRGTRVTDLNLDDLRDLYQARLVIEPFAVAKAAESFSEKDGKTAKHCLDLMAAAHKRGDYSEAWNFHSEFHFVIYNAARSQWLIKAIAPMWERSQFYRLKWKSAKEDLKGRSGEHYAILEACMAHNSSLASAEMYHHLARTANSISADMGQDDLFPVKLPVNLRPRARRVNGLPAAT